MKKLKQKRWFESAKQDKFLYIKKQLLELNSIYSEEGLTALIYASLNNSTESVLALLDKEILLTSTIEVTLPAKNTKEGTFTFPIGSSPIEFAAFSGSRKVVRLIINYCTQNGLIGSILGQFPHENRLFAYSFQLIDDLKIPVSDAFLDAEILGNARSPTNAAILAAKNDKIDIFTQLQAKVGNDLLKKHIYEMILYHDENQMNALDYINADSKMYPIVEKLTLQAQFYISEQLNSVNVSGIDFISNKEVVSTQDYNLMKKLVSHSRKGSQIYVSEYFSEHNSVLQESPEEVESKNEEIELKNQGVQ